MRRERGESCASNREADGLKWNQLLGVVDGLLVVGGGARVVRGRIDKAEEGRDVVVESDDNDGRMVQDERLDVTHFGEVHVVCRCLIRRRRLLMIAAC